MKITGWGRYPVIDAEMRSPTTIKELIKSIRVGRAIARGNGRSYGDSAISKTNTIDMRNFNRMLGFDAETGLLVVESGVLLSEIIVTFLPRGWFPLVTPGTKFVTAGGMVASDVHGKNHHKVGSFGGCVEWLDIIASDGDIIRCSREIKPELFNWTLGGMGLTGVILRIAFRLQPVESSWIKQKTVPAKNIEHAIAIFEETLDSTYSVAWIDCLSKGNKLGRSLVMLGEHAAVSDLKDGMKHTPLSIKQKKPIRIPFNFPSFVLNSWTVRIFNRWYYYALSIKKEDVLVDYDSYFYPLDRFSEWNKIYGSSGFAQFQCVLPLKRAPMGMRKLLKTISTSGAGSFLAVLKRFGQEESSISFPMEGYTLALDFPVTKKTLALMRDLDEITLEHGGRFYLSKDSRIAADTVIKSDPRLKRFNEFRKNMVHDSFASAQSERLEL